MTEQNILNQYMCNIAFQAGCTLVSNRETREINYVVNNSIVDVCSHLEFFVYGFVEQRLKSCNEKEGR